MDTHQGATDEKPGIATYVASWVVGIGIFALLIVVALLAIQE